MQNNDRTKEFISGVSKLKHSNINNLNVKEKQILRKELSNRDTLTVPECCVWLGKCRQSIYLGIKKGYIVAKRSFGCNSDYIIDVKKTKKSLDVVNEISI